MNTMLGRRAGSAARAPAAGIAAQARASDRRGSLPIIASLFWGAGAPAIALPARLRPGSPRAAVSSLPPGALPVRGTARPRSYSPRHLPPRCTTRSGRARRWRAASTGLAQGDHPRPADGVIELPVERVGALHGFARKDRGNVGAVERAPGRQRGAGNGAEGGQQVGVADLFRTHGARLHVARPAQD